MSRKVSMRRPLLALLLLGGVVAVLHLAASAFTAAAPSSQQRHPAVAQLAAREAEISRKQALLTAAALASGASQAEAEDLKAKVKAIMKEDPTPNDNGAPEKHIPKAYAGGGSVDVVVQHVMDKDKPHYIQYMWLTDAKSGDILSVKSFAPTDPSPPALSVDLPAGTTAIPMLFCNLHGLWEGEKFTMA
eukprot:TRINITY_DN107695_c0_g1_i1.p1 TRINITY_DN107695_c0_g1~~TRINITY_DN107695_c0_g1_i1.p1  ORF type:complete len:206 (-),score=52.85 TRINITY_DN107695_c0_g1_i1:84-650(-)